MSCHVRIASYSYEYCYCNDPMGCYHVMGAGHISDDDVIKTVKVKCNTVNKGVQNILKFLSTLNICKIPTNTYCLRHFYTLYLHVVAT